MFCDGKKCDKCGINWKITMQNAKTQEIKEVSKCGLFAIFEELMMLNQNSIGLRQDTQGRGNEIVKGMGHAILTNLKKVH